ncbi:YeeE/YedE family protein [Delftia sp. PS-11]|uniref:YeeE/YedE family protein n=1 Tax=Delftia sp. PS-11 TaxID=2767222 RepID=UPI002456BD14|nr:YeeE/YedE family protein [Delftia sp. PS-11]KAJ8743181.1 YeeE/YedE family protein [Delftia sp. PS-11]
MTIVWNEFTPLPSLAGGVLIGLSAAAMVVLLGRVTGISGIIGALLQRGSWQQPGGWTWRLAFLLGLLAAPWLWQLAAPLPAISIPGNPLLIGAAGLLVGFGTRLGSGCTSGHGVCGLSRLSPRSLAATLTFMASGALTVFVIRHVLP